MAEQTLSHKLRVSSIAMGRTIARSCQEFGLTSAQLLYLRQVWREEGMTQRELSQRVDSAESTTVSAIKILERQGLIYRKSLLGDRRATRVFLTDKGRELETAVMPIVMDINRAAVDGLNPDEISTLWVLLDKVTNNVNAYAPTNGSNLPDEPEEDSEA